MKHLRHLAGILGVLPGAVALAQSDINAKAAEAMDKLELRSEWRAADMRREDEGSGSTLVSRNLRLHFSGADLRLTSMRWIQRLDEIRARGDFQGARFPNEQAVRQRAAAIIARFGLGEGWAVTRVLGGSASDTRVSPELVGGAVSVEFGFTANGLRDSGVLAMVTFDTLDGKVVSLTILNLPGTTYLPPTNLITAQQAESRARSHAEAYLRAKLPSDYAESLIRRFPSPAETPVTLSYGSMSRDLDSRIDAYPDRRTKRYPIYHVDYGVLYVSILGSNGDCVGGGLSAAASEITPSTDIRPGNDRNEVSAGQKANRNQGDTSSGGPPARTARPDNQLSTPVLVMLALAVVGAGIALYLRRRA